MRFYAVHRTDLGWFVTGESFDPFYIREGAVEENILPEAEMRTDPALSEALDRWKAGDDRLAASVTAQGWLDAFPGEPVNLRGVTDPQYREIFEEYASEPACAALLAGESGQRHLRAVTP